MVLGNSNRIIEFIREEAARESTIDKVVLFGSRARGDHTEKSDFDIAIYASQMSDLQWARWSLDLKEAVPTLCGLDLILVTSSLAASLLGSIKQDGIVIYERLQTK